MPQSLGLLALAASGAFLCWAPTSHGAGMQALTMPAPTCSTSDRSVGLILPRLLTRTRLPPR